jgi:NADH:ubiquinone oxidoreductase subunit E
VQVCTSKHCCKNGSQEIINSLKSVDVERTINVQKVRCLGDCSHAPVVKISDRKYRRISPQKVVALALKFRQQNQPSSIKSSH